MTDHDPRDDIEPPVLPPHGTPKRTSSSDRIACRICAEPTEHGELVAFGARCNRCYRLACQTPTRLRPMPVGFVMPANVEPMHRWAWRLAARRDAGQQLGVAQRACLDEFERKHPFPVEWKP